MDTGVPSYGTNGLSDGTTQHDNIFDMFHSSLGHFWDHDRTGMGQNIDKAFEGQDVQSIFSNLFKGQSQCLLQ